MESREWGLTEGRKAGIKEVVDWVKKNNMASKALVINTDSWQAFLKEKGID